LRLSRGRTIKVAVNRTVNSFDSGPRARLISELVGSTSGVVLNVKALDIEMERTGRVISGTTSPFNSTRSVTRVTTSPGTKSNFHRRLGVVSSARISESTDRSTVHVPNSALAGPINGVGVEVGLG